MLIAPFSVPPADRIRTRRPTPAARSTKPRRVLVAWFLIGVGVLLVAPFTRGGRALGATLPFWLVAAPLIDLAWIERRRLLGRVLDLLRARGRIRPHARRVGAQRGRAASVFAR